MIGVDPQPSEDRSAQQPSPHYAEEAAELLRAKSGRMLLPQLCTQLYREYPSARKDVASAGGAKQWAHLAGVRLEWPDEKKPNICWATLPATHEQEASQADESRVRVESARERLARLADEDAIEILAARIRNAAVESADEVLAARGQSSS